MNENRELDFERVAATSHEKRNGIIKTINSLKDYWPLSIKQIFYTIADKKYFSFSQYGFAQLIRVIGKLEATGQINSYSLVEKSWGPNKIYSQSLQEFFKQHNLVSEFNFDLLYNQEKLPIIVTNKENLIPQIKKVTDKYSVPIIPYSLCVNGWTKEFKKIFQGNRKIIYLFVTSYTPIGYESFLRFKELEPSNEKQILYWLCILPKHIEKYNLPQSPFISVTYNRAKRFIKQKGNKAYDLDAMHPQNVSNIIENAINKLITHSNLQEATNKYEEYKNKLLVTNDSLSNTNISS